MKRVLVTGASGFVGVHLCRHLRSRGVEEIHVLMRNRCDGPWTTCFAADIGKDDLPSAAFDGVDTIFHLAGKTHVLSDLAGAEGGYRRSICDGTRAVVKAAVSAGVRALIYLSSVKAMGEGNQPGRPLKPIDESAICNPESAYGRAKLEAEQIVLGAAAIPHITILRPAVVYGKGGKGNLPRMIDAIRQHRFPPPPENGNRRSFVHVEDVVEACIAAPSCKAANRKVYVLAETRAYSSRQLYDLIRSALGMRPTAGAISLRVLRLAGQIGDIIGRLRGEPFMVDSKSLAKILGSAWYQSETIVNDFGFAPHRSLIDELQRLVRENADSGP